MAVALPVFLPLAAAAGRGASAECNLPAQHAAARGRLPRAFRDFEESFTQQVWHVAVADNGWEGNGAGGLTLNPWQETAAHEVIRRVQRHVPAELVCSVLFGSRARGDAKPDSDVDILLIFRALPPDREPQAGQAEQIAAEVAAERGVPVATWSVSLIDLERGKRTPMLVDALEDGRPLWPPGIRSPRVAFTPEDALRCVRALLTRVQEGGEEVAARREAGDLEGAARRARGDLVRLCTAALLLRGETRPRRGAAVRRFANSILADEDFPPIVEEVLAWAASSYGPDGKDERGPVGFPPGGFPAVADVVTVLSEWIRCEAWNLEMRLQHRRNLTA